MNLYSIYPANFHYVESITQFTVDCIIAFTLKY